MRLCYIDLETTGLSFDTDYITEIAWVIKDFGDPKSLILTSKLIHIPIKVSSEITELTKITNKHLEEAGEDLDTVVSELESDLKCYRVDYIVAHNGENFDKPMLLSACRRGDIFFEKLQSMHWIDTKADVLYPSNWTSRRLNHLAAELGFLNYFSHAALFDALTTSKVLEHFDIEKVIARSKEPWINLKACVSYDDREKAKKRRFQWEKCGDKTYPKTWVKRVKASDVETEKSEADFTIVILED